ncbi:MAG: hypothetical protein PUC47_07900 [Oscillospiraceae bacterium]|nr:hypothetical protein [Oscillospiraceae bacterium]
MSEFLEACMMVLFGCSWPLNILKSVRSRTARGRSVGFLILIQLGYLAGILSKVLSGHVTYVVAFYILNLCMVTADLCLVLRNRRLDQQRQQN